MRECTYRHKYISTYIYTYGIHILQISIHTFIHKYKNKTCCFYTHTHVWRAGEKSIQWVICICYLFIYCYYLCIILSNLARGAIGLSLAIRLFFFGCRWRCWGFGFSVSVLPLHPECLDRLLKLVIAHAFYFACIASLFVVVTLACVEWGFASVLVLPRPPQMLFICSFCDFASCAFDWLWVLLLLLFSLFGWRVPFSCLYPGCGICPLCGVHTVYSHSSMGNQRPNAVPCICDRCCFCHSPMPCGRCLCTGSIIFYICPMG